MSDEAKKSHWRSLAEQLGAEPAGEPNVDQLQPSGDETGDGATDDMAANVSAGDAPPAYAAVESKANMPEKTAADWSSLAISLGIDPADLPPPASRPAAPEPEVQPQKETEEASAELASDDAPSSDEFGAGDVDLGFDKPTQEVFEPSGVAMEEEVGFRDVAVDKARDPERAKEPADDAEVESGGLDAPRDQPDEQEEAQEPVPRRRRRRRRRRRGQAYDEAAEAEEENYSAPVESIESEVEFDSTSDDERDASSELDEQGTDAEPSTPGAALAEPGKEEARPTDQGEPETEPRRRRRRRRGRRGSRRDADATDERSQQDASDDQAESGEDQREESPDQEGAARTVVHRNIPTWDEAMGIIIAKNMEGRSKDPRSSSGAARRSGRGGRGGRGRGRSADKRS